MTIVHRIWLDDPLPDRYSLYKTKWEDLGYTVQDWRDSTALPFLHNQALFDNAQAHYPNDWKRFQADLLRLELLYIYGGIYADCDIEPHEPFPFLLSRSDKCVVGRSPQTGHPITNAFIYSEPNHPYIRATIEGCESAVQRFSRYHLARCIGPWHLTRIYESGVWDMTVVSDLYTGPWFTHHWANVRRKNKEEGWQF